MAYEIPGQIVTVPASTQVLSTTSANFQFRFVGVDANGEAVLPAVGASVFGVLQNKPTVDQEAASVMVNGISKVQAVSGALATGDLVAATSAGYASTAPAAAYSVGRVLLGTSSTTTGRIYSISLESIGTT